MSPTARRAVPWTALAALVVVAAFAASHGDWFLDNLSQRHWEDGRYFRYNRDTIHTLLDCFTRPSAWSGGNEATYRPLSTSLYYFVGRLLFDNRIEVYHAWCAFVYVGNGLLLFLVARRLMPAACALLPAALFVSRLAHVQVVGYTSEFIALSYVCACLAGVELFLRSRQRAGRLLEILALLAFGTALLCKEAAVVWPAILACYGWLFERGLAWRRYLAAWLVASTWGIAYPFVLNALYPARRAGYAFDVDLLRVLSRYAAYLLAFCNGLVDAVDPEQAGYAMAPLVNALAQTPAAIAATFALIVAALVAFVWARLQPAALGDAGRVVVFGFAWFLLATAPFVVLEDRLFMRYSYFGHAGLALAMGGLVLAAARGAEAQWQGGQPR